MQNANLGLKGITITIVIIPEYECMTEPLILSVASVLLENVWHISDVLAKQGCSTLLWAKVDHGLMPQWKGFQVIAKIYGKHRGAPEGRGVSSWWWNWDSLCLFFVLGKVL